MKRTLFLIVLLLALAACAPCQAAASGTRVYSADAARQYQDAWNEYFDASGKDLYGSVEISDDGSSILYIGITYNILYRDVGYRNDVIPSAASIYFTCFPEDGSVAFCVFTNGEKQDLERAVIYSDHRVYNDLDIANSHDDPDMWRIGMSREDVLDMYAEDQITLRLTTGGKHAFIDISREECGYLYEMADWVFRGMRYVDGADPDYLKADCLPEGSRTETAAGPERDRKYSFREDYDAIEASARSLFYVEAYDNKFEFLGNASGFVSFDEHLFVTNQHVIDGAGCLMIWDDDNNAYLLDEVVASDPVADIALLLFPDGEKYASLPQNTEPLKRGQPIVTIGSPQGLQGTVAEGIISALPVVERYGGRKIIQISAPISEGSSGGALFDDSGAVIGITSSGLEGGQNLNFAVPISAAQELYAQWDKSSSETLGTEKSWNLTGGGKAGGVTVTVNGQTRTGNYEGDQENGVPNGQGVFVSSDGGAELRYEGSWTDGKAKGAGTLTDTRCVLTVESGGEQFETSGTYTGEAIDGMPSGQGTFVSTNSDGVTWTYTGHFADGTFDGYGQTSWDNGAYEEGDYVAGKYTPTWAQVIVSMCKWDGHEYFNGSAAFLKNYESLFTSPAEIDPYLVYSQWDVETFRKSPMHYCSKLACLRDMTVLYVGETHDVGQEIAYVGLMDRDGNWFYGYIHDSAGLAEDMHIDEIWLLPMNIVTLGEEDGDGLEVILCAYTGSWRQDAGTEHRNSLELTSGYTVEMGRELLVSFDMENAEDGKEIASVEICVYAEDANGADLYDGKKYYGTTTNRVSPGKRTRSVQIRLPERSRISILYCGISRIEFTDGFVLTIDDVDFKGYTVR